MLNQIMTLSEGNPGAMQFLMEILNGDIQNSIHGLTILPKIQGCNIKGSDLYVLWSDLCDKDISKVTKLCNDIPNEVLIDACSRQDYTGKKLIEDYYKHLQLHVKDLQASIED